MLFNANVRNTIEYLVGENKFSEDFVAEAKACVTIPALAKSTWGSKGRNDSEYWRPRLTSKAAEYFRCDDLNQNQQPHLFGLLSRTRTSLKIVTLWWPRLTPNGMSGTTSPKKVSGRKLASVRNASVA